jgi:outer membrane immunogenic protein
MSAAISEACGCLGVDEFCFWNFGTAGIASNAAQVSATGTQSFQNRGWTGGGQIGFNYQYQWAVFGIEADIQAFRPKGSANFASSYPNVNAIPCIVGNFGGCGYGFVENSSGTWLTTVRGKVGAVWGNWLLYGTIGVAWAKLNFNSSFGEATCQFVANATCGVSYASFSQTKVGVAGGGGLSYMLSRNWIASIEYLRVEFWGVGGDALVLNTAGRSAPGTFTGNFHYDTHLQENILRAKLDYKF